jgi:hypothetical protein
VRSAQPRRTCASASISRPFKRVRLRRLASLGENCAVDHGRVRTMSQGTTNTSGTVSNFSPEDRG